MKTILCIFLWLVFACVNLLAQPWSDVTLSQPEVAAAAASGPAFVSEVQRTSVIVNTTSVIYLSNSVTAGRRLALLALSGGPTPSSVADSQGNTWTVYATGGNDGTAAQSASVSGTHIGTALSTSDSITVTWTNASYTDAVISLVQLSGCAESGQPDAAAGNSQWTAAVGLTATTSTADTVAVGVITLAVGTQTYGSGNWTTIGTYSDTGTPRRGYFVYEVLSSTGSQGPGGSWSGPAGQANAIAIFE